jgi:predicted metal-dependent peptidase
MMTLHKTIQELLIHFPFYGYAASLFLFKEAKDIDEYTVSYGNPHCFKYNPGWFKDLTFLHRQGILLHEILHLLLIHPFRQGDKSSLIWAIACDIAVFEQLPRDYWYPQSINRVAVEKEIRRNLPEKKSAEEYYQILVDVDQRYPFGKDPETGLVTFGSKKKFKVETWDDQSFDENDRDAIQSQVAQMMSRFHSTEDLPDGVGRLLDSIHGDFKINWRRVIKQFLTGRGPVIKERSFKRPSRRFDGFPGNKRSIGTRALIAVDESGSISDTLLRQFFEEIRKISRVTGVNISVVRFDTGCSSPVPLSRFVKSSERIKGGGTDFLPIFKTASSFGFRLVIVFTDGDGSYPEHIRQKCLWVLTKPVKPPVGIPLYMDHAEVLS